MDFIDSPPVHHQQQEHPLLPNGQGTIRVATSTPQPSQSHQQEQQQPPLHGHGTMVATITPQPPQPHQKEQDMIPAKIFFHQPQQQKKRGRPMKSDVDGLGLYPTPISEAVCAAPSIITSNKACRMAPSSKNKQQPQDLESGVGVGVGDDVGVTGAATSKKPYKKTFGRQPCSEKKQEALGGVGYGWRLHLIHVHIGEDIVSKILAFLEQGPRPLIVSILSATGAISDVNLRQSTIDGSTMTCEGQFIIITLSGSLLLAESNCSPSIKGDLSVLMSGPDHKVLCGVVSGNLKAASPVQVVVGSFVPKKEKPMYEEPSSTPPYDVTNFGASVTEATASFQVATSNLADE